ncbi:MAG: glycoside hydrolase family 88 protein [Lachnospiraceae bacterium]|nr:glycoside hydrolase family 88 protein [Lachnospiraceae bacterium]
MNESLWAEELLAKIDEKYRHVAARSADKIPYTTGKAGRFDDWSSPDKICWWTNGFWGGLLWQLYHRSGDEAYKAAALVIEEKLDENLMRADGMDHDSGFKWLLTSGANYQLTKSEASKNRLLLAANNLAGRFNLKAGLIRAWNDPGDGSNAGLAIIDCMMNLPLLYLASDLTKDPRFTQIAVCHAGRAKDAFVRKDGSVNHIVTFDPASGAVTGSLGGQGMQEGSCWSRGLSWAVYGFTLSYLHTKMKPFLDTACRAADYALAHIPESGLLPVDYAQDPALDWEDDCAGAITACGLLDLSKVCEGEKAGSCRAAAMKLLIALADKRLSLDPDTDYLLSHCSAAYHEERHNYPIVYADYYFVEALMKLADKELFLW